ncbi:MAG: cob(I)yrinic acid a,c-diamide adenosyltransferase [Porphyromonadaceae bacterium]|nr:MAG: cob(I)yrinic acid a,c-diamide adenosyltransferase [Porphyromonadaceae bacterium]
MRVYTRTGDKGETSLAGGTRVLKDHPRLEAYGTVDELNSHLGLIQATILDSGERTRLTRIQNRVFVVSSNLAADNPELLKNLPLILEEDITDLEMAMDMLLDQIPPLTNFILPAGHPSIASCHIARTVCRRAERRMVTLSREASVDPILIRYINRLSDYLFVLARKTAYDLGVGEIIWTSDFKR